MATRCGPATAAHRGPEPSISPHARRPAGALPPTGGSSRQKGSARHVHEVMKPWIAAPFIAALMIAVVFAVSADAGTRKKTAIGPLAFAPPTVVDNFRPGFEPDVAVDDSPGGKGATYTSTP